MKVIGPFIKKEKPNNNHPKYMYWMKDFFHSFLKNITFAKNIL